LQLLTLYSAEDSTMKTEIENPACYRIFGSMIDLSYWGKK